MNYCRTFISAILITVITFWTFESTRPRAIKNHELDLTEFSVDRAMVHVVAISKSPHFVGSEDHERVVSYLETELHKLGLKTEIQEGYILNHSGTLVKVKNILAKIKGSGNSKALMLLAHYDSAPHSSSFGASDDGAGVATILEGVRAFLASKSTHRNDIIVMFSDAEELGLNGASLFVKQHPWAKETGLVINFEARGTTGPSYMLMETNKGNAAMLKLFVAANPSYAVSNSLLYNIYKLLPNDTDLTAFRQLGAIQGFNLAFIDDYFNYHTAQDNLQHMDVRSLAHQGSYLMPLLKYLGNAQLNHSDTTGDYIYFNTPLGFIYYPGKLNIPFFLLTLSFFAGLIITGIRTKVIVLKEIGIGLLMFLSTILLCGTVACLGWQLLLVLFPQYADITHGFTYNGYSYIGLFVFLSFAICFLIYGKDQTPGKIVNYAIAPQIFWLMINLGLTILLPGAGFFIIPVFFSLISIAYFLIKKKNNWLLDVILSIPAVFIYASFVTILPVGLGMDFLTGSAILTALIFTLLLPVFGNYTNKSLWSFFMTFIAIGFLIDAVMDSDYKEGAAKPNSLIYVQDMDTGKAEWATYDLHLDNWTSKFLGNKPEKGGLIKSFIPGITYSSPALIRHLVKPTIRFLTDSLRGDKRYFEILVIPSRNVNLYQVFAKENLKLYDFQANGVKRLGVRFPFMIKRGKKVLSYYVVDNEPLKLQFSIGYKDHLNMDLVEYSFDLLDNPSLNVPKRLSWMIPAPFIINDAVILKMKLQH